MHLDEWWAPHVEIMTAKKGQALARNGSSDLYTLSGRALRHARRQISQLGLDEIFGQETSLKGPGVWMDMNDIP